VFGSRAAFVTAQQRGGRAGAARGNGISPLLGRAVPSREYPLARPHRARARGIVTYPLAFALSEPNRQPALSPARTCLFRCGAGAARAAGGAGEVGSGAD
jgi:hypothetical protein